MNSAWRIAEKGSIVLLALFVSTWGVHAEEQKGPRLESATYFGGAGNQGAAQDGMGIAVEGTRLYLSGADLSLYGGQALVACYSIPAGPGTSPVWSFRWPNVKGNGWWNDETFPGIAATPEGIYCAGRSWSQATDGVGGKETKAVLVKFTLSGPTGPQTGGALWVAEPHFFPYTGIETFMDVTVSLAGAAAGLYATGRGQSDGSNNTAVLAKFDTTGRILWAKVLGKPEMFAWSQGDSVRVVDGSVYVAGYTHWQGPKYYLGFQNPIRPHAGLWKVDPSGNVLWLRESTQPICQNSLDPVRVVSSGGFLYVSAAQENASNGGSDVLLLKYSQAGDLLWSKNWGSSKDDVPTAIAAEGKRLYIAGHTTGWVGGGKDIFLLEMDAENGEVLSVNYHGGLYDDVPYGLKIVGTDLYVGADSKSSTAGSNSAGQSDFLLLRYSLTQARPPLGVTIDIHPGSVPNPISLKSMGKVPVAILSTQAFDAPAEVDRTTVTFGRTGEEKSLVLSGLKPEDVNKDGLIDLIGHFDAQRCGFQVGDVRGILMGKTLSGRPFLGTDSVVIVPKEKEKEKEMPEFRHPKEEPKQPARRVIRPDIDSKKVPGGSIHGPDKKDGSIVY